MNPSILKIAFVAIAVVFAVCAHSFAQDLPTTQAKEALLIANSEYTNFGKLPNPIPDARKLAASLRQIGFQVVIVEDADREKMLDAIGDFEKRLKASRGIAFFHYGGHGVQVDGSNYLIPANADIPDEKRVSTRAVDLGEVMSALDASGSVANIVVLDACRDNPLPASTRSATRGLSVVQSKPKNSIIIFAAEAGSKAEDGLFTPILADAITTPGRTISDVVMQVRREVNVKSGGTQTPGEYNQLFNPIVLNGFSQLLPSSNQAESTQDQPEIKVTATPTNEEGRIVDKYTCVITNKDRRNSGGIRLDDPVLILMQDRANVHKFGNREQDGVDNFFSDASHRARIRSYIERGSFPLNLQNAIKKDEAVGLQVSVLQDPNGKFSLQISSAGVVNQQQRAPQREASLQRYTFIDSESNFRAGPGTGHPIKYRPLKGTVGTLIGKNENWICIQLENGDSGWAHQQNLRIIR